MRSERLLQAVAERSDPRPVYPPSAPRPRHALVSGQRTTLCGARVKAISPFAFEPDDQHTCGVCRRLADQLRSSMAG